MTHICDRLVRGLLAAGLIVYASAAQAQTDVALAGPRVTCSDATLSTTAATRPAGTGWVYEVRANNNIIGRRDRVPYEVRLPSAGPGNYVLTSRWIRGTEEKKLDQKTVICHPAGVTTQPVVVAPPPPPPPPTLPVIGNVTANPSLVTSASVATVRLNFEGVVGATKLDVSHGVGDVTGLTFKDVPRPEITTVYRVTATNAAGSVFKDVTVTVNIPSPPPPPPPTEICGDKIDNDKDGQVDEGCSTTPPPPPPAEICGDGADNDFDGLTDEDPPCTATKKIWGNVDPAILGEWSAAEHDADEYLIDGGDGWWYRTYHPQCKVFPNGVRRCTAHEHGDDPATQRDARVRKNFDARMGYAARRDTTHPGQENGHEEPHEGYKIHVVNVGDVNDEGRVNQTATTSMPHTGSSGPARFSVNRHSVSIADAHQNGIHYTAIHAMFDTGVGGFPVETPCLADPNTGRHEAPTKDGLIIGQKCKVNSSYEIWTMVFSAMRGTQELLRKFVTPAVFDPITVHDPARPTTPVYAWDPIVAQFKNFPNDWSHFRGCAREGYSQVGYHYTGNEPSDEYLLDVRTNQVVTTANAFTTRLVIGRSNTAGQPPFSSDILQFKMRRDHCQDRNKLGLKN